MQTIMVKISDFISINFWPLYKKELLQQIVQQLFVL